ncbi:MAG: S1 RNA-binding domain-containing protein [Candidatus Micrarchaeota archaeon]
MERMPEKDELVIATIRKIFPYGAFCSLDEYDNREAFVHISEVASRWVKNIHEFLKENQKVVARVYHFLPEKNQIDLSMRRVSESEKKLKLESVKREKRAGSLLKVLAKRLKKDPAKFVPEISALMEKEFETPMDAFERIAGEPELVKKLGMTGAEADSFLEIAAQNIKKPKVEVSRTLDISCAGEGGIDVIMGALESFEKLSKENTTVNISYLGAPHYRVKIVAEDYKTAEKMLQSIVRMGTEDLKKHHCTVSLVEGAK